MALSFGKRCIVILSSLFPMLLPVHVMSQETQPNFSLPLECVMGVDCFIQNYVDRDASPQAHDYHCGFLTYDGHSGTDFRERDLNLKVHVLAAADGVVRAMRDGMEDIDARKISKLSILGREAGNVVVLDHGNGWETLYGHMLKGSVTVRQGQIVQRGQVLGTIGLSGQTEFPHVHFEVTYQGKSIDPFAGIEGSDTCRLGHRPLWSLDALSHLDYRSSGILEASFSTGGAPESLISPDAKRILFTIKLFGIQNEDAQIIDVYAPSGQHLSHSENLIAGNKAEMTAQLNLVPNQSRWPLGDYVVAYSLLRDKKPVIDKRFSVRVGE